MAGILQIPYYSLNCAQIDEALTTYSGDSSIVTGLTALKTAIQGAISSATPCLQCSSTGTVDSATGWAISGSLIGNKITCPLCEGQENTSGTYVIDKTKITNPSFIKR